MECRLCAVHRAMFIWNSHIWEWGECNSTWYMYILTGLNWTQLNMHQQLSGCLTVQTNERQRQHIISTNNNRIKKKCIVRSEKYFYTSIVVWARARERISKNLNERKTLNYIIGGAIENRPCTAHKYCCFCVWANIKNTHKRVECT